MPLVIVAMILKYIYLSILLVRLPLLIPEQRLADGRELVNVDGTVPVLKHI